MLNRFYVILSACLSSNTDEENDKASYNLNAFLKARGFIYDAVEGVYEGGKEDSFVVMCQSVRDMDTLLDQAKRSGQECILVCDVEGNSHLMYCDSALIRPIGKLFCYDAGGFEMHCKARGKTPDYTFHPETNKYYVVI
ncbi:hypothetical protein [Vibrio phage vB_VpaP_G1]|uniref:Uncharacterized protein n=1 Tax=Vibrio phage vB_VpaP_G1 TaxID=2862773 RepID=A0AAE7WUQ0_9CAUD|nr:SAM-dependent methyltransferase [Vibrio phage vB_VpaP_G1]QYW05808.1 hypothetical protein [Vibrio phage vB_VpaP_G1]